jgi:hypothetical protein
LALDSKHGDLILFPTNDSRNRDLLLALLDGVKGSSEGVLDAALAHLDGLSRPFDGHGLRDLMGREGMHYTSTKASNSR